MIIPGFDCCPNHPAESSINRRSLGSLQEGPKGYRSPATGNQNSESEGPIELSQLTGGSFADKVALGKVEREYLERVEGGGGKSAYTPTFGRHQPPLTSDHTLGISLH